MEITAEVGKATTIRALAPSRVLTQSSGQPEEVTADLTATGAEMTEQREVKVQLSRSSVERQTETRVNTVVSRLPVEATVDLGLETAREQPRQEEVHVDL